MYIYTHVCVYICMHICVCVYRCMCMAMYKYVYMYIYVYVCIYVSCTYACVCSLQGKRIEEQTDSKTAPMQKRKCSSSQMLLILDFISRAQIWVQS